MLCVWFPELLYLLSVSNFDLHRIILMTCRSTSVITAASLVTITADGNNLWDVPDLTKKYQDVVLGRDFSDCLVILLRLQSTFPHCSHSD